MENTTHRIDAHRRLSIRKDFIELTYWLETIEDLNHEIDHLKVIERQLVKIDEIAKSLQGLRRKNTLVMGVLCKYEQEIKKDFEFSKREYDELRAQEHEKRRDHFTALMEEFKSLKNLIYNELMKYRR